MIIKCPECGHQVSDQAKTCPSCGIEIMGKITRCPDCGEYIFKEQSECPNCHCSINGSLPVEQSSEVPVVEQPVAADDARQPQQATRARRRRRVGITAFVVAFVISLIVVFLGIYFIKNQEQQNEQRAYENAIMSTEPLVLQNFLDMYTDAPRAHCDSIKMRLESLKKVDKDWTDALVNNTKFAFERYMKMYPQSPHNVEAKIKIDSLDWQSALKENTAEAFQAYLNAHEDGAYYDEARSNFEKLEAQKVTSEDRLVVSQLFVTFFNALAQRDEAALTATLSPVLTSFLHRSNATKADVLQYMEKLHEDDITRMEFIANNDWEIEKNDLGEDRYGYTVAFSVAQHMERTDEERETSVVFKVNAKVSPDGHITELNMKRSL
jgi:hypothetical protein